MNNVLIISRHVGLIDWLATKGVNGRVISHLGDGDVADGDIVIGTLPVHLVADITSRGALYIHVRIDIPEHLRGQELDRAALDQLDVSLIPFAAQALSISELAGILPAVVIRALDTDTLTGMDRQKFL